jgi:hypothetical protein
MNTRLKRSPLTRGGGLKPVSAKRAKINRIYSALRKKFLQDHPYCQWFLLKEFVSTDSGRAVNMTLYDAEVLARSYPSGGLWIPRSVDVHHMRCRGKYLLDTSTWMAVSRAGHEKIHSNVKESYEKGYMLPRN